MLRYFLCKRLLMAAVLDNTRATEVGYHLLDVPLSQRLIRRKKSEHYSLLWYHNWQPNQHPPKQYEVVVMITLQRASRVSGNNLPSRFLPEIFRAIQQYLVKTQVFWISLLLMSFIPSLFAEGDTATPKAQYVHLQPAFVLNYGGSKGRLKYLRTEVALRVLGNANADLVSRHIPYLRNQLVFLLSQQTDATVNSSQGREELRKQALEEVRATMVLLEKQPLIEDLYFQNFVVQN
jgi:flagellar FliL protein